MKGKVSVRFDMPNLNRFRSRVQNPSKDLTSQFRDEMANVVAEILNESQLKIRAKFIEKVNAMDLEYASDQYKVKIQSLVENFFDVYFAATPEALKQLCGETEDENVEESSEENTEEPTNFDD